MGHNCRNRHCRDNHHTRMAWKAAGAAPSELKQPRKKGSIHPNHGSSAVANLGLGTNVGGPSSESCELDDFALDAWIDSEKEERPHRREGPSRNPWGVVLGYSVACYHECGCSRLCTIPRSQYRLI
jgi:hypothetical protein